MVLTSLFDGIGCFPIAWANVNNIKYQDLEYNSSEIMPFLLDVIKSNFPKSKQYFDITKISNDDLLTLNSDIITMGTPCTGFSLSGKRDGLENIESKLFSVGVDIIDKKRPKYFIWENVFGVFSANEGLEFRAILDEFKRIGYDAVWTTIDTQYLGLPHRRRRVYMIGIRDGIERNHNIYNFVKRSSPELKNEIKEAQKFHKNDFNINSSKPEEHHAFYNRQRSDIFKEVGLSSTLAKRDYKSFVDVVIKDGSIRRITPKERLRLQGIPETWFDATYDTYKSDVDRFKANGMSIPSVEYVFENLLDIESKKSYENAEDNINTLLMNEKNFIYNDVSSKKIHLNKPKTKKTKSDKVFINIPLSGHMRLDRDEKNNVKSDLAEYLLIGSCEESKENLLLSEIKNFLLDKVDEKYHLKEGACNGILKREIKSGNPIPYKMKDVIFHKYPKLKNIYS